MRLGFPLPLRRGGANVPRLLQRSLKGLALRGGLSMPECSGVTTRIVQAVHSRSSQGIGPNPRLLFQCLSKSLKGLALRGGLSMPECSSVTTRIVQAVRSRSSRGIGANPRLLFQCLSKSLFGVTSSRPLPSLIPGRFPLLARPTGS